MNGLFCLIIASMLAIIMLMNRKENSLLLLKPIFKERLWGGRQLSKFGYPLPPGNIGECWGISGHPHGPSEILNGAAKGQLLSDVYQQHQDWFNHEQQSSFPLLVKIIDAQADLSVQVHPDDHYALNHEHQLGKHESWLVLHAEAQTRIQLGHRAANVATFKEMVSRQQWEQLLVYDTIAQDDVIDIKPGTLHALCAGTMVLEIQQSSDVTYRVYDYHRLDQQGQLRQLHLEQAFDVTTIPHLAPTKQKLNRHLLNTLQTLVQHQHYTITALGVDGKTSFHYHYPRYRLGIVIEGEINIGDQSLKKGNHFILTSLQKEVLVSGRGWVVFVESALKHS